MNGLLVSSEEKILATLRVALAGLDWDLQLIPSLAAIHGTNRTAWCDCLFVHSAAGDARHVATVEEAAKLGFQRIISISAHCPSEWEERLYERGATFVATLPLRTASFAAHLPRRRQPPPADPVSEPMAPRAEEAKQQPEALRELGTIREFARLLRMSRNNGSFVGGYLEHVREVLGINRAALYLADPGAGRLACAFAVGIDADVAGEIILSVDRGIGGYIFRHNLVAVLGRTALDHDARREMDTLGAQVAVPVRTGDQWLGVLLLGPRLLGDPLTREEIQVIYVLMEGLGLVIANERLHQAMAKEQTVFATVLDRLHIGYLVLSADLKVVHAHPLMWKLFGLNPGEAMDWCKLPSPLAERIFAVAEGRASFLEFEHRIPGTKDGYLITARPFPDEPAARRTILVIAHEYTSVWEGRDAAVVRERSTLLGLLGAQASHLFKNALTPIGMAGQLLPKADQDYAGFVAFLRRAVPPAVARMNRYIDQLYQVGCVDASREEIAVVPLVKEAWATALALRKATGASAAQDEAKPVPPLELVGESEARVLARTKALVSGLAEVMLNAIEAAPDAKAVRVTFDDTRRRMVGIVVHDDGAGISPQALSLLGQPFQSEKTYGFGLGYSVLRAALADCEGLVEYGRSKQLKGAMCTVVLPTAKAEKG